MVYCVECGCCSGELAKGWVAMRLDDPDTDVIDEGPTIALYCPPCAAAEFGYRPDVAADYVCVWDWEPIPNETPTTFSTRAPRGTIRRLRHAR